MERPPRYRDKLVEDLRLRGLAPATQEVYLSNVRSFFTRTRLRPVRVCPRDVRTYLLSLTEAGRKAATRKSVYHSLAFFFATTMGRPEVMAGIPVPRVPRRLPVAPTRDEVQRLLAAAKLPRHHTWLSTLYATGLRVHELVALQVEDIDSRERLIRVRHGKGGRARVVPLSSRPLAELRAYYAAHRPPGPWLFGGRSRGTPIAIRSVQHAFAHARSMSGIRTCLTVHSLRHAFATHSLEDRAIDLRMLQVILGHSRLETTAVYLEVCDRRIADVVSPLDRLHD